MVRGSTRQWSHLKDLVLQWVHGRRTVVRQHVLCGRVSHLLCFNGSTVGEPWLGYNSLHLQWQPCRFNGSTVGEPWLGRDMGIDVATLVRLQWVHGRRTVVRLVETHVKSWIARLQWVHGRRTVVRRPASLSRIARASCFNGSTVGEPWLGNVVKEHVMHDLTASMGPRSENRG